jgi:predicted alpha/beta-fold hydrolase
MMNAGQTCIAPDHLYVHESIKATFERKVVETVRAFFGDDPQKSPDFGRMINERHFDRVSALIDKSKVLVGGQTDRNDRFIAPTVLTNVSECRISLICWKPLLCMNESHWQWLRRNVEECLHSPTLSTPSCTSVTDHVLRSSRTITMCCLWPGMRESRYVGTCIMTWLTRSQGGRLGLTIFMAALVFTPLVGASSASAASSPKSLTISGAPWSSSDSTPVQLDADLYLPSTTPAPAVVLAHGFGGSKQSVREDAEYLVERGFAVLAYSARGFGESTGLISMNSPDFEVADARAVIDFLASQSSVQRDAPGDPRVGIAGGSYGGALALLAAGYDNRIDAVAADITWNNLETSLFAQSVIDSDEVGVLKQLWTSVFFSAGLTTRDGTVTTCGRFAPDWCSLYLTAATTGSPTVEGRGLMRRSSPVSITDRITAYLLWHQRWVKDNCPI